MEEKYYIMFSVTKEGKYIFRGYTTDKEIRNAFIKQRPSYVYKTFKKSELNSKLRKRLNDTNEIIIDKFEDLMLPDEEEYFIEGLWQYLSELEHRNIDLQQYVKYLDLDKHEKNIFFELDRVIKHVKFMEEEDCDYEEYLDIEKARLHIIDQFR